MQPTPYRAPGPKPGALFAFCEPMKFLKLYLIGYFVLLFGAVLALWQSGILEEIPGIWIAIGAVIAVGLGIMLAVSSGPRTVTTTTSSRDV
jgi:hypothetical protein